MVGGSGGEDIKQPNDLRKERSPHLNLESICCAHGTHQLSTGICTWVNTENSIRGTQGLLSDAAQMFSLLLIPGLTHYTPAPAWAQQTGHR